MTGEQQGWAVGFSVKAGKQARRLPDDILPALHLLVAELKRGGPHLARWRNYGPLRGKKDMYHCHLNGGKPRYVAVWKVERGQVKVMEIIYVGTHEGARYDRME
jgi:hypothetical protein